MINDNTQINPPSSSSLSPEPPTPPKQSKEKIKTCLIIILFLALLLTWSWPYLKEINLTSAFVTDYLEKEGIEGGSYFQGKEDAPVKIIVFSDFQCPYCAKFSQDALPQIREEYIKTGKVKLVFKHLPLAFHSLAEPAALASLCAGKQGKFWDYHDQLFANQGQLNPRYFEVLAQELGLDLKDFQNCLLNKEFLPQLTLDKKAAAEARLSGTPSFLINGERQIGALPFSQFKEIIERKLAGKYSNGHQFLDKSRCYIRETEHFLMVNYLCLSL